ncbi:hypothetical protein [Levilactobacillus enshiensis]|uniref:hypothetical protein n=1 Tax=Levilactobacillus enshiensis TaxID=2590213 RepID=UPI00117A3552|nr:hypothetical protein [Levilactobacillus enshiensis]
MLRDPNRKPIYFTIIIDLKGSRTNFVDQEATSDFISYFVHKLNAEFIMNAGTSTFQQKDGDSIMIVLQEGMEALVYRIYQFCNSLYYRSEFQKVATTKMISGKDLAFYFSVGVGTVDTNVNQLNNVDVVNGSSISRATEGIMIIKRIVTHQVSTPQFSFKKSPFKLFINTGSEHNTQPSADAITGLFYLLYEKILNTKSKRFGYALLYPERQISNIDLAHELAEKYNMSAFNVDYNDPIQRSQVSSKISVMLAPVKKEPIVLIQNAIINGLRNIKEELVQKL